MLLNIFYLSHSLILSLQIFMASFTSNFAILFISCPSFTYKQGPARKPEVGLSSYMFTSITTMLHILITIK